MQKQLEQLEQLERELTPDEKMSSSVLRARAKAIAGVGLESFTGELLRRCLDISAAIVDFSDELDKSGG